MDKQENNKTSVPSVRGRSYFTLASALISAISFVILVLFNHFSFQFKFFGIPMIHYSNNIDIPKVKSIWKIYYTCKIWEHFLKLVLMFDENKKIYSLWPWHALAGFFCDTFQFKENIEQKITLLDLWYSLLIEAFIDNPQIGAFP